MADNNELNNILQVIRNYNPLFANSERITLDKMTAYARVLAEYNLPASLIEMVFKKLILSERYFPPISAVLSTAKEFIDIVNNQQDPDADEAWLEVQKNISTLLSSSKPIQWSSPLIKHAVHVVSIEAIIHSKVTDSGTIRAQFRDAYNAAVNREKKKREVLASFAMLENKTKVDLMTKIQKIGTIKTPDRLLLNKGEEK